MDEHVDDEENVVGLGSVQEDAEVVDEMEGHNFAQGWDAFLQEDEEEETEPTEMAQSRAAVSGKDKVSEEKNMDEEDSRSEFDESSDEDYVESDDSEDDEEGYKKLVDEGNYDGDEELVEEGNYDGFEELEEEPNVEGEGPNQSLHDNWYSDPGEEDELLSLDGSDDEIGERSEPRHHFFKEGEWNMKGKSLVVGMKFENFRVYREALRDYCVRNGFDVEYIKNESDRITVTCKNQNCKCRLHASSIQNTKIFQIKSLKGGHSCAKTFNNKLAKSNYIAKRLEQMIRDNPHVSNDQLRNAINRKCGVEVSSAKVSRAKREAIDKIVGLDSKQYDLLWDYCETVRARNPGSLILLKKKENVEPPNLIRLGRDGNGNMVPIVIAVVQVENYESWKWFLSVLLEDIGGMDSASKWTFISDRQEGLIEVVSELAPYAEHRFCLRHMYESFKRRYKTSLLKDLFWRAASSANKHDFEMCMKRIELADPKIDENVKTTAEWLREIPFQHWCRAYFRTSCKSDILVNNLYEEGRDVTYAGVVCPNILKKINKQSEVARNCTARFCGGMEFEVDRLLDKYVVDLDRKTCTCGMYQLNGYPCCHAYAAITNKRNDVEDYVDVCYKKETYLKVYEYMIHVVPGQRDYIKTNYPPLRAPAIKRKRGRPKKARMRGPATQQTDGFDAPQPTQASQSAPIGNQRPRKQSTRGGRGTYQGTKNAALLSACTNQGGSANMPTPRPRKSSARGGSANIPTESESTTRRRIHTSISSAGSSGGTSAAPAGSVGISAAAAGSGSGSGSGFGSGGTIAAANTLRNKHAPKKKTKRTSISDILKNNRDGGFEKRPRK
ncbi:hypothetical protein BUALT_Bualt08G0019900 [Buddleja alternifolia]|uniref:SWIM-type domain-containing protein n=1 Tax=Buddleja alternifolia TaxID=168488 RepID=A0AAV6X2Y0_9LAMI|nr:hypothetical protein BUALT_Bualt08G0019900 [Buddleja alternifolia]